MNTATVQPLKHISMKQAAKQLDVCPRKLFAFLRRQNILKDGKSGCTKNAPYDKYANQGLFHIEFQPIPPFNQPALVTRVTPKGLLFLEKLLDENPEEANKIRRRNPPTKKTNSPRQRIAKSTTAPAGHG